MAEFSGLQIEVRCVRCGRLPTADVTLYELQNHLYLCNVCRQEEEQRGRQIAWIGGRQEQVPAISSATPPLRERSQPTIPLARPAVRSALPPDSIFALLELPLETPRTELTKAIRQRMSEVMRQPDSPERKRTIQRLGEWREKLQDDEAFEEYRASLKTVAAGEGHALMFGRTPVLSTCDLLTACEANQQNWAAGEHYMRSGELRQWIIYQIEDRQMAEKARYYQNWTEVSDFRAFNELLYALMPERPFRFYAEEKWEPVEKRVDGQTMQIVPTATTPEQVAALCDIDWLRGEQHLYHGSMVYWLESSQHISGVSSYFQKAVAGYTDDIDSGVGLELLLEYVVPGLPRPRLVIAFDGREGSYVQNRWDREIVHKPVSVTITNTTRGFVSLNLSLSPMPPGTQGQEWLFMPETQGQVRGRPGNGLPVRRTLLLSDLARLNRGQTYRRYLNISVRKEHGTSLKTQQYPIDFKMMNFFQGFHGILWLWGLRGGAPALALNFLAGLILALVPFEIFSLLLKDPGLFQLAPSAPVESVLQALFFGGVQVLIMFTKSYFFFFVGVVTGVIGGFVGNGKGHAHYEEFKGRSSFRKAGFWLAALAAVGLVIWDQGYQVIGYALQANGPAYADNPWLYPALASTGASLLLWIIVWVITWTVAAIRLRLETFARQHYYQLLHPAEGGKQ